MDKQENFTTEEQVSTMKATNIEWDYDTDAETGNLPNEIEIPATLVGNEDAISDYITEQTGFCHKGFELEPIEQSNDVNKLFAEMLDTMEFSLVKTHENPDKDIEDGEAVDCYRIQDRQEGWNDKLAVDAAGVIEELDRPFNDYFLEDLENEFDTYFEDIEFPKEVELPWNAEGWSNLYNQTDEYKYISETAPNNFKDFVENHEFEFACCDLVANHIDEVDLDIVCAREFSNELDWSNAVDMGNEVLCEDDKVNIMLYLNGEQYQTLVDRTPLLQDNNVSDFNQLINNTDATLTVYVDLHQDALQSGNLLEDVTATAYIAMQSEDLGYKDYPLPLSQTEKNTLITTFEAELQKENRSIEQCFLEAQICTNTDRLDLTKACKEGSSVERDETLNIILNLTDTEETVLFCRTGLYETNSLDELQDADNIEYHFEANVWADGQVRVGLVVDTLETSQQAPSENTYNVPLLKEEAESIFKAVETQLVKDEKTVEQSSADKPSLYEQLSAVVPEGKVSTYYSDLYVPVTLETTAIINDYYKEMGIPKQAETFKDQNTGEKCYEVPFGYMNEYAASKEAMKETVSEKKSQTKKEAPDRD